MKKINQTLLGVKSPGDELAIHGIQRIKRVETINEGLFDGMAGLVVSEDREVLLNAWTGSTEDGHPVHISYQVGEVTIQVDLPTGDSGRSPLTLMRWKPRLALGLITPEPQKFGDSLRSSSEREGLAGNQVSQMQEAERESPLSRFERAKLAEMTAESADIKALNGRRPRILSEGELLHWLSEHNRRFKLLHMRGLAGGKLRFRVSREDRAA